VLGWQCCLLSGVHHALHYAAERYKMHAMEQFELI
jgi:hypothetical protein